MKILFETNRGKIKDTKILDEALRIIEKKSLQGFFRSKGESVFKKYNEKSIIEDAKLIELHIVKDEGKGEYKFNGNLSFNQTTKQVKFYILSVIEFDTFKYDEVKMAEFKNIENRGPHEDIIEMQNVIDKMKKTKPKFVAYNKLQGNNNRRTPNPKRMPRSKSAQEKVDNNKYKKNFRTDSRRDVSNNKKSSF